MDRHAKTRMMLALNLERKAEAIGKLGGPAKRDFIRLKIKVAELNQHAFRIPVENGALIDDNPNTSHRELSFLAARVRMSSHELISYPINVARNANDYTSQLERSLDGLALLGCSDISLFFGDNALNATYARTLAELTGFRETAALDSLDRFDDFAFNLMVGRDERNYMRSWIDARRSQIEGKPPRLLAAHEVPARVETSLLRKFRTTGLRP